MSFNASTRRLLTKAHLTEAITYLRQAERELSDAGLGTSPTFYRIARARRTIERRLTGKHLPQCACSNCLARLFKRAAKLATRKHESSP